MQVYVNETACDFPLRPEATLGEVLDSLYVELPPGHIMTEISVDGKGYHAAEREVFDRRRVQSVERLGITTQSPGEFAAVKRLEVGHSLALIGDKARHAASLFHRGDVQGASSLFASLLEELRLTLMLDQEVSRLEPACEGGPLPVASIEEAARDLLAAQEKKAWRTVATLLESALVPVLQSWAGLRLQPSDESAGAVSG